MFEHTKHALLVLTALLTLATGLARAEDTDRELLAPVGEGPVVKALRESRFTRPGTYVGAGISYASDTFENEVGDAVGVSVDAEPSLGAHVVIGYRFHPFVATELEYEWISDSSVAVQGFGSFTLGAQTVTANLKTILPVGRFQPYLLAGVGATRWKIEGERGLSIDEADIAFAGRATTGFDVYLTRHIVLNTRAGVVFTKQRVNSLPGGNVDYLFYVSAGAGLQYRFNGFFGIDD